jgi:ABC-type branched-subunit amino acid transport system ATPase component
MEQMTAAELPLGPARLVDLGRALCSRPKVLLLDEPVSGLDPEQSLRVARLLREFAAETQMAVFVVEHDLDFAQSVADRIIALDFGKVIIDGLPQAVLASREVQAAYLGIEASAKTRDAPTNCYTATNGTQGSRPSNKRRFDQKDALLDDECQTKGALELLNVTVEYHGAVALDKASFRLEPGTITAVLGPNGAGKTTLANAIGGLVHVDAGQIVFDGVDVTDDSADRRARLGIGILPDTRAVFPSLTVTENFHMGFRSLRSDDRAKATDAAMQLFPQLRARATQRAGSLSGGEQQMLAIARLAVSNPGLLVADEISHGLAPIIVEELFALVESLRGRTTVVIIEQFVGRALACADRVIVLRGGSIELDSPTASITRQQINELYRLESVPPPPSAPQA